MNGYVGISSILSVIIISACTKRFILANTVCHDEGQLIQTSRNDKKLCPFVVMPSKIEISFKRWRSTVLEDHEVDVQYPFERHGKLLIMQIKQKFLEFIDNNSQPDGRHVKSHNPTHYFYNLS